MGRIRWAVLAIALASGVAQAASAGWNPKLAAAYLDQRQREWFAWPAAAKAGGPCVSCHTGLPYLIVRPALRRALGESAPTEWETGLRAALRARLDDGIAEAAAKSQAIGTESIFAALFLPGEAAARDRLWKLQLKDGPARGGWNWYTLERDPWENAEAPFFGAALAALAVKDAPAADRDRVRPLIEYLKRAAAAQPLQNRLAVLWTAPGAGKREWIEEAFSKQAGDGGWTAASIGPWKARAEAPPSAGSDSYATAFVAFALLEAGVKPGDARMARALGWLRSHQDAKAGYWDAVSMNKRYEPGSMPDLFMRDAATGFAAAALLKAEEAGEAR